MKLIYGVLILIIWLYLLFVLADINKRVALVDTYRIECANHNGELMRAKDDVIVCARRVEP